MYWMKRSFAAALCLALRLVASMHMKKNEWRTERVCLYMFVGTILFYLFADFSNTLTKEYGVISLLIFLSMLFQNRKDANVWMGYAVVFLALQIPPIFCWIALEGSFSIFGLEMSISYLGALWHLLLLGMNIVILIKGLRRKDETDSSDNQ